jgi:hypothetical protein
MIRPLFAISVMALLSATASSHAGEALNFVPRSSATVSVEQLFVRHFLSSSDFAMGSPVSVLDYDPFVVTSVSLGGTLATSDGPWIDFDLSSDMFGSGTLIDSDFSAGRLFSQTLSTASSQRNVDLTIKGWAAPAMTFGSLTVQPFVGASLTTRELFAAGLRCGSVCATSALPETALVMRHHLLSGTVELGATGRLALNQTLSLIGGIEVAVGGTHLADDHVLRADLGPAPNIVSDFRTIGMKASFGPTWILAPQTTLTVEASVAATYGVGTTTFGPMSALRTAGLPSDLVDVEGGLRVVLRAPLP